MKAPLKSSLKLLLRGKRRKWKKGTFVVFVVKVPRFFLLLFIFFVASLSLAAATAAVASQFNSQLDSIALCVVCAF